MPGRPGSAERAVARRIQELQTLPGLCEERSGSGTVPTRLAMLLGQSAPGFEVRGLHCGDEAGTALLRLEKRRPGPPVRDSCRATRDRNYLQPR